MDGTENMHSSSPQSNGHVPVEPVVLQNRGMGSTDERPAPTKLPSKVAESKSPESQIQAYEKQYRALQQQLRQRDIAMMDLADENENLNKSLTDLKEACKEASEDRARQAEKIKRQQISLQSSDSSLREAQAALVEARREANEARRDANDARREVTETSVALADAKAEVWAVREAAKGKALGEDERRELEAALKALSISAQRAAQEAGSWKDTAGTSKQKIVSLQNELDSKAQLLASMENELSLARQYVKDSEIQVQEANHLRSVADMGLQELRLESDRRARTFNAAVKAAVSKIQTNLEADRDAALSRIVSLESEVMIQTSSLKETNEALSKAGEELSEARSMIGQLHDERQASEKRVQNLQEEVISWQSMAQKHEQRADAAHEVADGLTNKLADLETRCEELTASCDMTKRNAAMTEAGLVSDVARLKLALTSAQNDKQLLQISSSERISKAMADQIALRATISDLEGQLRSLRGQASGSSSGVRADYRLDNLGLERVNWKHKLRHQDVEKQLERKASKDNKQPTTSSEKASSWAWSHQSNHDSPMLRGRLSQRSIVMIIYIVALHIIVMVSFTQRSQSCVAMVDQTSAGKLPGQ